MEFERTLAQERSDAKMVKADALLGAKRDLNEGESRGNVSLTVLLARSDWSWRRSSPLSAVQVGASLQLTFSSSSGRSAEKQSRRQPGPLTRTPKACMEP
eukprot:COSAG02_NODE_31481_length_533_cov_0.437788_2_plen_99_part_01